MGYRVGSGFDVHRLKRGRRLVAGCVALSWPAGPAGHSDGDPVAHALADAMLGGAGLGDIGEHFPDTDPAWKDCPGERILRMAREKVAGRGLRVVNADVTVFLEKPHLKEAKEEIRERLAALLEIAPDRVALKAKTAEGFGPVGRGDAIGAHATVLLETS
jgi:2-C-methyl-D-erythritol 2,4-cyclodiphosphate synthase